MEKGGSETRQVLFVFMEPRFRFLARVHAHRNRHWPRDAEPEEHLGHNHREPPTRLQTIVADATVARHLSALRGIGVAVVGGG